MYKFVSGKRSSDIEKAPDALKNEGIPIRLVADFATYIDGQTVQLTKTKGYISRKHTSAINDRLTVKAAERTPHTEQDYYPYIHFLFHIALSGRLLEKATR